LLAELLVERMKHHDTKANPMAKRLRSSER
jgi:hypothetical protein